MQKSLEMDRKLIHLSCPFTWNMENVIQNQNKLSETKDDRLEMIKDTEDYFPEFAVIYHLMLAYERQMRNNPTSAMESINEAEKSFAEIKLRAIEKNAEKVLQHIIIATKCNVLQKLGQPLEISELLKGICDVQSMNKKELAMLSGCECLAWSLYYVSDNLKAIDCARRAIQLDPDNGKWQFLLGRNLRRLRRMHQSIHQYPNEEEISAFEKAYSLSKNVWYGASLGLLYKESKNYRKATEIYKEVYALKPTSCTVQLQLAKGFIGAKERELAKKCLDYVGERMPDSITYAHYMGIYEEKFYKNYKAALPYLQRTTEKLNFMAEWQYVECKKKVEPNWNPLPYMLNLTEKYKTSSDHIMQGIYIQIGYYYLSKINDILSACRYLTKAIKIKPDAKQLKMFFPIFESFVRVDIYRTLREKVQFALQNDATKYDDGEIAMLRNTLQLCRTNFKN